MDLEKENQPPSSTEIVEDNKQKEEHENPPFAFLKGINLTLLGWGAIVLSLIGYFVLTLVNPELTEVLKQIPAFSPFLILIGILISILFGVLILHVATTLLKIPTRSWKRALFSIGVITLANIVLTLIFLPLRPAPTFPPSFSIIGALQPILSLVILFTVLMKTFKIRFLRTLWLIIVQFLVTLALGILIAGLALLLGVGLGSLFKPF